MEDAVATDGLRATERRTERKGSLEDAQGLAPVEGQGAVAGLRFRPQPEQQVVGQRIERGMVAGNTPFKIGRPSSRVKEASSHHCHCPGPGSHPLRQRQSAPGRAGSARAG